MTTGDGAKLENPRNSLSSLEKNLTGPVPSFSTLAASSTCSTRANKPGSIAFEGSAFSGTGTPSAMASFAE